MIFLPPHPRLPHSRARPAALNPIAFLPRWCFSSFLPFPVFPSVTRDLSSLRFLLTCSNCCCIKPPGQSLFEHFSPFFSPPPFYPLRDFPVRRNILFFNLLPSWIFPPVLATLFVVEVLLDHSSSSSLCDDDSLRDTRSISWGSRVRTRVRFVF